MSFTSGHSFGNQLPVISNVRVNSGLLSITCLFSTLAFGRSRGGHLISTTDIPQVWDFIPLGVVQILVVLSQRKKIYVCILKRNAYACSPNTLQQHPWQNSVISSSALNCKYLLTQGPQRGAKAQTHSPGDLQDYDL